MQVYDIICIRLRRNFKTLGGRFDFDLKQQLIENLEEKMLAPHFWDDHDGAQKVIAELNALKKIVEQYDKLEQNYEDSALWLELVTEEQDEALCKQLETQVEQLQVSVAQFELQLLLSEPYDKMNAIVEIHPGAGGTESQDWGQMLLRMYTRWGEKQGFQVEVLSYLPGDEAGIKNVTLLIKGFNAYGYIKAEKGVHRLVRISPFDASGRRHTSFASCDVIPEITDDIAIDVQPEDMKIDTYRASGAGGQHINTTDSAVRITHIPTGIVVTCQTERSQIKNRERALIHLRSKLYERQMEVQQEQLSQIRGEQLDIAWGSQIRSYILHPYSMVKDHRTQVETGNVDRVLDGELDPFIHAYLRTLIQPLPEG